MITLPSASIMGGRFAGKPGLMQRHSRRITRCLTQEFWLLDSVASSMATSIPGLQQWDGDMGSLRPYGSALIPPMPAVFEITIRHQRRDKMRLMFAVHRGRIAVITRFVLASVFVNLSWFLISLPRFESNTALSDAALLVAGAFALAGQGMLFGLGLAISQRSSHQTLSRLSRRTFIWLAVGQPLIASSIGTVMMYSRLRFRLELGYVSASLLGAILVAVCLRGETRMWAWHVLIAMLIVAGLWALIPIGVATGYQIAPLSLGALGRAHDERALHPLVTALWQIPMAGLVAIWLTDGSARSPSDGSR